MIFYIPNQKQAKLNIFKPITSNDYITKSCCKELIAQALKTTQSGASLQDIKKYIYDIFIANKIYPPLQKLPDKFEFSEVVIFMKSFSSGYGAVLDGITIYNDKGQRYYLKYATHAGNGTDANKTNLMLSLEKPAEVLNNPDSSYENVGEEDLRVYVEVTQRYVNGSYYQTWNSFKTWSGDFNDFYMASGGTPTMTIKFFNFVPTKIEFMGYYPSYGQTSLIDITLKVDSRPLYEQKDIVVKTGYNINEVVFF